MKIRNVTHNKKAYMDLLLLADEQEDMIARYLGRGELFALYDPDLRGVCVVTDEGAGTFELKNLAVPPKYQRRGYGRALVVFCLARCAGRGHTMLVGTGDSPLTLPFYHACGFREHHRVPDFFLQHYDHPICEGGRRLVDMVYLSMEL